MWYIDEHSAQENFIHLMNYTIANNVTYGLDGKPYRPIAKVSKDFGITLCGHTIDHLAYDSDGHVLYFVWETTLSPLSAYREEDLHKFFKQLFQALLAEDESYGLYFSFGVNKQRGKEEKFAVTCATYDEGLNVMTSHFVGIFEEKANAVVKILEMIKLNIKKNPSDTDKWKRINDNKFACYSEKYKLVYIIEKIVL